jgi:putative NADH-flavin reductase
MLFLGLFIVYAVALSVALARAGYRTREMPSVGTTRSRPKRLLIIGATGGTGRELVAQALDRGYTVTALVRNPSKLQPHLSRVTVIQGDVLDRSSVEKAMHNQDAVVSALGHKRYFYPTRILSEATRNILQEMEIHGVRRFVCETSLGIGDSAGRMGLYYTLFTIPAVLPFYFWDKTRQERLIAESEAEWVIVRPGALSNADKRGCSHVGRRVGNLLWTVRVARADVAEFMLDQLESDTFLRGAPGVAW